MQYVGGFDWWGTTSFLIMVGRAIWNSFHLLKLVHESGYFTKFGLKGKPSIPHGTPVLEHVFPDDLWMLFFVLKTNTIFLFFF